MVSELDGFHVLLCLRLVISRNISGRHQLELVLVYNCNAITNQIKERVINNGTHNPNYLLMLI